jgi:hypothetical protein
MVSLRILVAIASFSGSLCRRFVIAHKAESVNLPAGFQARLSEGLDELLPVIIKIDVLSPVAPAHDVINSAGKFNSQRTWHADLLPKPPLSVIL